jgi:uncharacterized membrane protein
MNIVLWIAQIVIAFQAIAGSAFRFFAYDTAAKDVPSVQALPHGVWNVIGVFEIVCALGLILPGLLRKGHRWTYYAAVGLAVEMFLVTLWHVRYFGLTPGAENPATWTFGLAVLSALVAWGRRSAR